MTLVPATARRGTSLRKNMIHRPNVSPGALPSLIGENEVGQTYRGVRGVFVGVVPRVQSKLSHALHTHDGKKLLQDQSPKPVKHGNKESYGKVQGSAGEGRRGICGIPRGFARRHDGGPPVEGDPRQKPGIA